MFLDSVLTGKIEKADMERVFKALEQKYKNNGKIKIYAEVKNMSISNISAEAMKSEFKMLFSNPKLIANIAKGVLVTNIEWMKLAYAFECGLLPTLEGKVFRLARKKRLWNGSKPINAKQNVWI